MDQKQKNQGKEKALNQNPKAEQARYGAGKYGTGQTRTITQPWTVFSFEIFLFSLSMGLGILAGMRLQELFEVYKISPTPISLWQFIVWFALATLALVLVVYFLKFKIGKHLVFKGLFLLAALFGNLFFFNLWFSSIISLFLVLVLTYLWFKKSSLIVHNLFLIFAVSGVGAGLGLRLDPKVIILLLLMFSIYDYLAVYKTKHMIKMAKEMIREKSILGIVVPQKLSDFKADLNSVKTDGRFLILGAGDIVFPLIFSVSLIPQGITNSLIIAAFSLLGLLAGFLIFISQKFRKPMPALPPVALFSIVGYLITRIIT